MKKAFFILSIVFVLSSKSQTFVPIQDANFFLYLQSVIPTAISGNSLNITSTLVTTATQSINVEGLSIVSLNGIQYFTSLQYLNCYNNAIPALPTLPNTLQYLYCGYNSLVALPALSNSLLTLSCYDNFLTALPALPASLSYLDCDDNLINCFPAFPSSITTINLFNNPYGCLPNYVLPAMNAYTSMPLCVAGNTNGCALVGIKELNQNNNEITAYPNPASNQFIIETNSVEKQMMQLFDLNGKLLFSQNLIGKTTIDVSILNEGVYNLTIKTDEMRLNKKLIIVKE